MDVDDKSNDNHNNELWPWVGEELNILKQMMHEVPNCTWGEAYSSVDDIFYTLNEQTPVKECADFGHQLSGVSECDNKMESEEALQLKRRRMLQYSYKNHDYCSIQNVSSDNIQGGECSIDSDCINQLVEEWLVDCGNADATELGDANKMLNVITSADQVSAASAPCRRGCGGDAGGDAPVRKSKGMSVPKVPPGKRNVSVAYPFTLIKPSDAHGSTTLNGINQLLGAPPKFKMKHMVDAQPSSSSTSALTGKPIVFRTMIRTGGRRGSITILRTKG